jgi:exodeoxyribonuclease VII large subunit
VQRHGLELARVAGRLSVKGLKNRCAEQGRRLADLRARERRALDVLVNRRRERFVAEAKMLASLSYRSVLARGFAVVKGAQGKPIPLAAGVKPAQHLEVEFADGTVNVTASKEPGPKASGQGSLF